MSEKRDLLHFKQGLEHLVPSLIQADTEENYEGHSVKTI